MSWRCRVIWRLPTEQIDWVPAAELAVRLLMPQVVIISLLKELDRWRDEAPKLGIPIPASR
ncbi:MAG: hypothetical protein JOZ78_08060 [Chroococcidiopsidaceae cyanobacterium CP_BM_ER_R8_30]|nr:hypothetical protein [Chroococcidiopsidaceae cyanobacterium CP_BM_ER_R8_30]